MSRFPEVTQNMFQEGLHQVFVRERSAGELKESGMIRWFGSVVNTHLLLTGVVQIVSAVTCVLSSVSYTCVMFDCSLSLMAPVWCGLCFIATGSLAIEVQRKPHKTKVMTLMALNIFSSLFAVCSSSTFFFKSTILDRGTNQQRIGVYVLKGIGVVSTLQCVLGSIYTLFLIWRGMRVYSTSHTHDYNSLSQVTDENTAPLLKNQQ